MDMRFNTTKSDIRSSSQEYVYGKLKEEQTCEEYIKAWLETK